MPDHLQGYDEREAAGMMSRQFSTKHHFREIVPGDLLDSLSAIAWHLEEPRGSTCYAPWVVAREAGSRLKVILSGHGGDELFAGYRAKYLAAKAAIADWEHRWFTEMNYLVPRAKAAQWLEPHLAIGRLAAWPREVFDAFVSRTRGMTPQQRAQHHDLFVYMQGLLLIEDKLSMAHGLESRVPLLDRRIFDFAWSLPDDWKLTAAEGKAILREALRGVLPQSILSREKSASDRPTTTISAPACGPSWRTSCWNPDSSGGGSSDRRRFANSSAARMPARTCSSRCGLSSRWKCGTGRFSTVPASSCRSGRHARRTDRSSFAAGRTSWSPGFSR